MAKDVVCGMDVDSQGAAASEGFGGETYYFCSTGCAEDFRADPTRYLSATGS